MNTRDPFNLRRKSPLDVIQTGITNIQAISSNLVSHLPDTIGLVQSDRGKESNVETDEILHTSVMSHSGISETGHKRHPSDDTRWQPQKSSRARQNNGIGEKLTGMFSSSEELPMYKDKPYNYAPSGKRKVVIFRKRLGIVIVFIILALVYFLAAPHSRFASTRNLFSGKSQREWSRKQDRVREAFKISWRAYENSAWGKDEFHPLSKDGTQMSPTGLGWIIVDALDTLILMNLTTELSHAREWISTSLDYDQNQNVNTFETTIRMLGGLLSAQYLTTTFPAMAPSTIGEASSEDLYLEKATDLAERLASAYESGSGLPFASVNLKQRKGIKSHADGGASSTAEAGTTQLEMKYLSKLTGETQYWEIAEKAIEVIDGNGAQDGLVPIFIYADTGLFRGENIRLGSRGDSYYEYLIKQYLQTSKQEPVYLEMWDQALAGVQKHLITYSEHASLTILAERPEGLGHALLPKMDHLVCFMPGTIALAVTSGRTLMEARKDPSWGKKQEAELELAKELMKTCWGMYKVTATGLAPEIAHFNIPNPPKMMKDGILNSPETLSESASAEWRADYDIHGADWHNLQRPETVESLFYMWRITGDVTYRQWGWEMFESFVKYTSLNDGQGFSSVNNVGTIPPGFRDNMESFWLAETLKYFYLLFGPDDVLPLDQVVFNTEAHPLPRFELGKLFKTGWTRKPRGPDGKLAAREESNPPQQ